jgi:hypothetical protein
MKIYKTFNSTPIIDNKEFYITTYLLNKQDQYFVVNTVEGTRPYAIVRSEEIIRYIITSYAYCYYINQSLIKQLEKYKFHILNQNKITIIKESDFIIIIKRIKNRCETYKNMQPVLN